MNLMEILQGHMTDDVLGQLSNEIGAEKEQTAAAANGIFASLLGGLANNASSPTGLMALAGALDKDHDGSVLDDLMGMVTGTAQPANTSTANGMGILKHVLGDQQEQVASQVGQAASLNAGQVMKLMPILAPILMGVLGRAKSSGGVGLGDLAGILMGSAQGASQMPGMGGILGSVLGGILGGGQQQAQQQQPQQQDGGGLLGNILGGILGGR